MTIDVDVPHLPGDRGSATGDIVYALHPAAPGAALLAGVRDALADAWTWLGY